MNNFETQLNEARNFFKQQKFSEASQEYFKALKLSPGDPEKGIVWAELSWVFYQLKEYERSIEAAENTLQFTLEYEAKDALFRIMGYCYSALSEQHKAIEYLEKSLAIERDSAEQQMAAFELIKINFHLQRYVEAEQLISDVENYFYQNEKAYWLTLLFFKGFVHYYLDQFDKSENIFEELLENSEDDLHKATAMFGLAFVSFSRKDYVKTINLCETVTKNDPAFFDMEAVGFLTAASFDYLGRHDVFEKYYFELKKKYPQGRFMAQLDQLYKGGNGKGIPVKESE